MTQLHLNLVWSTVRSTLLNHGIASSKELNDAVEQNLKGDYSCGNFSDNRLFEVQNHIIKLIKHLIEREARIERKNSTPSHNDKLDKNPNKVNDSQNKKLESPQNDDSNHIESSNNSNLSTTHTSCLSSQRNTRPGNCSTSE